MIRPGDRASDDRAGACAARARRRLRSAGLPSPDLDARILTAAAAGWSQTELVLRTDERLGARVAGMIDDWCARRATGTPVSRLIGRREFYGTSFAIGRDAFDPRPDSETLVDAVLARHAYAYGRMIDLGTGSGCLLLSVLTHAPAAVGIGVDRNPAALRIARRNVARSPAGARVRLHRSDWFSDVCGRFDVVMSNPPYIPRDRIDGLPVDVRAHDPRDALDGGADGLDAYRAITATAAARCVPGGRAYLEIGETQGAAVTAMMRAGGFVDVETLPDRGGRPRVVCGRTR